MKSWGTKLEAPTAPRIEMPKVSRGMRNGRGHPSCSTRGSRQSSNHIIIYEGEVNMVSDSEPRNFFSPPLRSLQKSYLGRQNLLALQFQYIVTLANCNKTL